MRRHLDFGDYSARCTLPDGSVYSLESCCCIERKYAIDELVQCFTRDRTRFRNEFERARAANAKLYLLVEMASWEKLYAGMYRSKASPQSIVGSLASWQSRYNFQILFCMPGTTGRLIYDVLFHELRERLKTSQEPL